MWFTRECFSESSLEHRYSSSAWNPNIGDASIFHSDLPCRRCNLWFSSVHDYRSHLTTEHNFKPVISRIHCRICRNRFNGNELLKRWVKLKLDGWFVWASFISTGALILAQRTERLANHFGDGGLESHPGSFFFFLLSSLSNFPSWKRWVCSISCVQYLLKFRKDKTMYPSCAARDEMG